ncbi:branched-chain amino acid aminotransferase [Kocuria sp. NPDC057446]|uniref:branched-chain amino acid aminotransferase n=1 Tax=Kocuria sp. NPDC057446 TaxID=3346137 RepID=UPI0036CDC6F0
MTTATNTSSHRGPGATFRRELVRPWTKDHDLTDVLTVPVFDERFTDHMVLIDWDEQAGWHDPRVTAYGALPLDPAAAVLHYGLEIFEGLKAYRHPDGSVWAFRPERNAARFRHSARRLALPELSEDLFLEAIRQLVEVDRSWVPSMPGTTLYLRPMLVATDPFIGLRTPQRAQFVLIAGPTGPLHPTDEGVSMWVSSQYSRAGQGGTGAAKCGGNYASSLVALQEAVANGCAQVLFLDAATGSWLEEAGNMNIFLVRRDGTLVTPPLGETILAGVTRASIIELARQAGHHVEERPIALQEWRTGVTDGTITEAFACGTAAVITAIGQLRSTDGVIPAPTIGWGPVTAWLHERLTGIQFGQVPDENEWMVRLVRP